MSIVFCLFSSVEDDFRYLSILDGSAIVISGRVAEHEGHLAAVQGLVRDLAKAFGAVVGIRALWGRERRENMGEC